MRIRLKLNNILYRKLNNIYYNVIFQKSSVSRSFKVNEVQIWILFESNQTVCRNEAYDVINV